MVQPYVKKRYFYKKSAMVFEVFQGAVGGVPWPVWAYLVDGSQDPSVCHRQWNVDEEGVSKFPRSSSSSRRWRRKWQEVPIC